MPHENHICLNIYLCQYFLYTKEDNCVKHKQHKMKKNKACLVNNCICSIKKSVSALKNPHYRRLAAFCIKFYEDRNSLIIFKISYI